MAKRSNLLDIINGLMIIFIIITHFRFAYPDDYMKYGFFYWVDMAVPVFMIITGYLIALSAKNINSLWQAYRAEIVIKKLLRFLIPWLPIAIVEVPILAVAKNYNCFEGLKQMLRGGYGPGAYYTPIMIQMIFLGPIIYYVVKKYDLIGFVLCFLATGAWEAISYSTGLEDGTYALIALRYISLFAFGCYIAIGKRDLNPLVLMIMFIVGIVWQTALNYIPLQPPFMNYAWARVNLYASFFVLPIMYVLIKKYSASSISIPILQEFGKASYNIFLVQMAFYGCGPAQAVYEYIGNGFMQLIICFVSCLIMGYVYYRLESPITKKVIKATCDCFEEKAI